jgi:peroxiredoxin
MKLIYLFTAAILILGFTAVCAHAADPAPNFALKTADGKTIELKKLQGKVVIVNFWATWCPPCRREIPGMTKVYAKYEAKGLEIVGIALDNDGWGVVTPWIAKNPINYPVVLGDRALTEQWGGIPSIPTTFIIDRKGNIAGKHVGMFTDEEFEKVVKGAL